jgi:hypothetical protein
MGWVRRDHGLGLLPRKLVRASARLERQAWRRGSSRRMDLSAEVS